MQPSAIRQRLSNEKWIGRLPTLISSPLQYPANAVERRARFRLVRSVAGKKGRSRPSDLSSRRIDCGGGSSPYKAAVFKWGPRLGYQKSESTPTRFCRQNLRISARCQKSVAFTHRAFLLMKRLRTSKDNWEYWRIPSSRSRTPRDYPTWTTSSTGT